MKYASVILLIFLLFSSNISAQVVFQDNCLEIEIDRSADYLNILDLQPQEVEERFGPADESYLLQSVSDTADTTNPRCEWLTLTYHDLGFVFSFYGKGQQNDLSDCFLSVSETACAVTKRGIKNGVSSLAQILERYGEPTFQLASKEEFHIGYTELGINFGFHTTLLTKDFSQTLPPKIKALFLMDPGCIPIDLDWIPKATLERVIVSSLELYEAIEPVQQNSLIQGRKNVFWIPKRKVVFIETIKKNGKTTTRTY